MNDWMVWYMQFNSHYYMLFFLPITILLYFLANKKKSDWGKIVLIVASIFFFAIGRENMLIYLGISILVNYGSVLAIKEYKIKNKIVNVLPIIVNVGLLAYFKYYNFALTSVNSLFGTGFELRDIVLPLGISFYTFQQIAYVVSFERGELENTKFIDYLTYILYFPKILMGPLMEPGDFISQINQEDRKKINIKNVAIGAKLISFGLIKKVLLADTFSKAITWSMANFNDLTALDSILLLLFYVFELYFDFSGYSDMAIGTSSMFNIDLPINFDSPYKALSIRDFWKRWHISLTKFLTKYVYIPLGGSRNGKLKTYINVMIVFLISGIWHGDNWTFILWGFLNGLFCCFDRLFENYEEKIPKVIRWFCTFLIICVLWALFSAQSVGKWTKLLGKITNIQDTTISEDLIKSFDLAENQFIYDTFRLNDIVKLIPGFNMWVFILLGFTICLIPKNNYRNKEKLTVGSLILASLSFAWGVLCLGTESIFVYTGF